MAKSDDESMLFPEEDKMKSFKKSNTEELTNAIKDLKSTIERLDRQNKFSANMKGAAALAGGAVVGGLVYQGMEAIGGPGFSQQLKANPYAIDTPTTRAAQQLITSPMQALQYSVGNMFGGENGGMNLLAFDRKKVTTQNLLATRYINDEFAGSYASGAVLDLANRGTNVIMGAGAAIKGASIFGASAGTVANLASKTPFVSEAAAASLGKFAGTAGKIAGIGGGFGIQAIAMVGKAYVEDAINQRATIVNNSNAMMNSSWNHVYGNNANNDLGEGYSRSTRMSVSKMILDEGYKDKWYDVKDVSDASTSAFNLGLDADINTDDASKVGDRIKKMVDAAKKISAVLGGSLTESMNEIKKMEMLGSTSVTDMMFSLNMETARKAIGIDKQTAMNIAGSGAQNAQGRDQSKRFGSELGMIAMRSVGVIGEMAGKYQTGDADYDEYFNKQFNERKGEITGSFLNRVSDAMDSNTNLIALSKWDSENKKWTIDEGVAGRISTGKLSLNDIQKIALDKTKSYSKEQLASIDKTQLTHAMSASGNGMKAAASLGIMEIMKGAGLASADGTNKFFDDKSFALKQIKQSEGVDEITAASYYNLMKSMRDGSLNKGMDDFYASDKERQLIAIKMREELVGAKALAGANNFISNAIRNTNLLGVNATKEGLKLDIREAGVKLARDGESQFSLTGNMTEKEIEKNLETFNTSGGKIRTGMNVEKAIITGRMKGNEKARTVKTAMSDDFRDEIYKTFMRDKDGNDITSKMREKLKKEISGIKGDKNKKAFEEKYSGKDGLLKYSMEQTLNKEDVDENLKRLASADKGLISEVSGDFVKDNIEGINVFDKVGKFFNRVGRSKNLNDKAAIEVYVKPNMGFIDEMNEMAVSNAKNKNFKTDNKGKKIDINELTQKFIKEQAGKKNDEERVKNVKKFKEWYNLSDDQMKAIAKANERIASHSQEKGNDYDSQYLPELFTVDEETGMTVSKMISETVKQGVKDEKVKKASAFVTSSVGKAFALDAEGKDLRGETEEERNAFSRIVYGGALGKDVGFGSGKYIDTKTVKKTVENMGGAIKDDFGEDSDKYKHYLTFKEKIKKEDNSAKIMQEAQKFITEEGIVSKSSFAKAIKSSDAEEADKTQRLQKYKELASELGMAEIKTSLDAIAKETIKANSRSSGKEKDNLAAYEEKSKSAKAAAVSAANQSAPMTGSLGPVKVDGDGNRSYY